MNSNTDINSKIIDRKTVFQSRYFKVEKATIERDGKTFTKDILSRTSSVIILPINENDEIVLVSQYRDSHQKFLLETVAGHIEDGDSPLESAKKELEEETGFSAKTWRHISSIYTSANIQDEVHIFYATNLTEGKQNFDEDEDIEIVKVPFSKALEKINTGEINVSSNIVAILLLDKLRKEGKV